MNNENILKADKLKKLIDDFLLIASATVDVEFFTRFLNSDASVRTVYNGCRLPPNGYTKFYFILTILQNIKDIENKSGYLYTFLEFSAKRHKIYITNNNNTELYNKLFLSLLWTFRNAFIDEWIDEYEQLLTWGWNIIMEIFINTTEMNKKSIAYKLTRSRQKSFTFIDHTSTIFICFPYIIYMFCYMILLPRS